MRRAEYLIAAAGLCLFAAEARAAETRRYDVPAGSLGSALATFGEQAGLTIGVTDPGLASRRTRGVRGRLSVRSALRRLLDGTGAGFVFVDAGSVRIVPGRLSARRRAPRPVAPPARSAPSPAEAVEQPVIIVTASKQRTPLDSYSGTVSILTLDPDKSAREASRGTSAIIARLPMLTSTSLGPGRDKLFIRGIADSSFNGPSQATVGQYLGDVRLTYNAPDPDLNLYDIGRAEVLEGPQGTLYGTGSLGGIIRLVPNAPELALAAGSMSGGAITTRNGGPGGDFAAMLNLPLWRDRLAVRAVGYGAIDSGYIDDPGRRLTDINRTTSFGGRVAFRFDPGANWSLTLGGALQNIASRDGQYVLRGSPPLTRRSTIRQPFDNDYQLAYASIGKRWPDLELSSTTGIVRHDVDSVFDATRPGTANPSVFEEDIGITLLSHETRLAGGSRRRSWVVGVSGVYDISRIERRLGPPSAAEPITGVRNENSEVALFGQYTMPILPDVSATLGGRLTRARAVGMLLGEPEDEARESKRNTIRASPTLALSWQVADRLLGFAHYQQGFRAGGLAVAPSGAVEDSRRFEADSLTMSEVGFRFGRPGRDRFTASATLAAARWSDIQSDLVDVAGLPYTTNIGDGHIYSFEGQVMWEAVPGLTFEASAFVNDSTLSSPEDDFAFADARELPSIARVNARGAATYQTLLARGLGLTIDGALRYVGASQLGIGAPLDVAQGDYLEASIGGRMSIGKVGVSLDVSNLGDVKGNRFSYGNPFGLADRNQLTPLRPRSIRVGLDARF